MLRIGIAIPCYKHHISVLKRCLQAIEEQTVKPHSVIVSCSSSEAADIPPEYFSFSFPLQIITHSTRKNAAENRNIAAAALLASDPSLDYISFFDADDLMHPQRLEAISQAFQKYPSAKLLLHSFILETSSEDFQPLTDFQIQYGVLCAKEDLWCAVHPKGEHIHHSQITVHSSLTQLVEFNDAPAFERREDADYAARALVCVKGESLYCGAALSKYLRSGEWIKM